MTSTDENGQRLLMIRKAVHDKLMERKKDFEERLGEEVSFDAFLMQLLEEFERIEKATEEVRKPMKPFVWPEKPYQPPGTITWYSTDKTTDKDTIDVHWTITGSSTPGVCPVCGSKGKGPKCTNCGTIRTWAIGDTSTFG